MGKSSLIIVLGMSIIIAFFILRLNANSTESVAVTMNMFEQTHSRLISNSGVEIYLEKLKHDRTMLGGTFNGNSLFGGTYDVTITGPEDLVLVTSKADFMGVKHTTFVEAAADKVEFHPGPGALYLEGETVAALKKNAINGNIEINGNDHYMDGTLTGSGAVPGICVDGTDQFDAVIDMITNNTIDQITGLGGFEPNVHVVTDETDWIEYAQLLADNPDILINTQEKADKIGPWGTIDDPKVTFVNGDIHINDAYVPGGCGILVVNGNLEINGGFNYVGLIVSYKEADIIVKLNGNGSIIGGMVVAGSTVNVEVANGTFEILYSSEALALVQSLLKTKRFTILSWWE